jgi:hypothetical protein
MRGIRPSVDAPALDYVQLSVDARAGRNPSLKKRAGAPVTMVSLAVCATDLRLTRPGDDPQCPGAAASCQFHGARPSPSAAAASPRSDPALAAAAGAAAKLPCRARAHAIM